MTRGAAFVVVCAALATGCLFQKMDNPARFTVGPTLRALPAAPAEIGDRAGTARATGTPGSPEAASERASSVSASLQFTMRIGERMYAGGEAETGRLEATGSNVAGAYGVIGVEHTMRAAWIGAELAAGWRGIRYDFEDENRDRGVVEPRVRAHVRLGEQFFLGGVLGTSLGDEGEWMAGVHLGVNAVGF